MRRFEKHDESVNAHKFWEIYESGGGYYTEYGRVEGYGRPGGRARSPKGSGQKWDGKEDKLIQSKLRDGYREIRIVPTRTPDRAPKPKPPSGLGLINWATLP